MKKITNVKASYVSRSIVGRPVGNTTREKANRRGPGQFALNAAGYLVWTKASDDDDKRPKRA